MGNLRQRDLRIGNIVTDIFEAGNPVETILTIDDFIVMNNYLKSSHPIPYQPIFLTDEVLLKFDLQPIRKIKRSRETLAKNVELIERGLPMIIEELDEIHYFHLIGGKVWIYKDMYGHKYVLKLSESLIIPVTYVHELQNIYHSITKNELQWKN